MLGYFLTRDIPESKEESHGAHGMDWLGLVIFMVTIFSLQRGYAGECLGLDELADPHSECFGGSRLGVVCHCREACG